MKKILLLMMCGIFIAGVSGLANATLWDRGEGLIYDDVLDITWLQDANLMVTEKFGYLPLINNQSGIATWDDAMGWIGAMNNANYLGYNDWRLPTTVDGDENPWGYDGTTNYGYNIITGEMGYMYYVNLGNRGYYAPDGTYPQPGWGLANTTFIDGATGEPRSFSNVIEGDYWSETVYSISPTSAWCFKYSDGLQFRGAKQGMGAYAWAVRPGDVAVPLPGVVWLLGSGLIGLAGFRRKFKK